MSAQPDFSGFANLRFDNRFTGDLPADPEAENFRRQVSQACYSRVRPTPIVKPQLVAYAREVAELLDLTSAECESPAFAEIFAGNRLIEGMDPYATCYGGHQFGNWAGQLGDGRAINLGEVVNRHGERWTLQLKGAGPTPYSRSADGLAVLRSSLREFMCSEAMHHLGVPTTRALSLILTGEEVVRDMFYDGNPKAEPGAVVCRVAPSFTRFGNFEIFAARKEIDVLRTFLEYTIEVDFPELGGFDKVSADEKKSIYIQWFEDVCRRTAEMIVHWMRVGFVHGVMNTDNMSILGLTIDYGPYGWLENYDPDWTPNTTDAQGRRYRFGQQPQIALWNLVQLANAIYPLIEDVEPLEHALDGYGTHYDAGWRTMMAQKLGLRAFDNDGDEDLISELLAVLALVETDMTIFFRQLAELDVGTEPVDEIPADSLIEPLMGAYYVPAQVTDPYRERMASWLRNYVTRLRTDGIDNDARRTAMNAVNPKYVLRNYLVQLAIDQIEQGDHGMTHDLLDVLRKPYDDHPGKETYAEKRPDWARHRAGCSMLSCSS